MEILLVWGHKFRPWGYEVRVDLQDDSGQIYNEALSFPVKSKDDVPDKETINKAIAARIENIKAALAMMAAELVQEPIRKAQQVKSDFMLAVDAGLLKAADMIAELQSKTGATGKI